MTIKTNSFSSYAFVAGALSLLTPSSVLAGPGVSVGASAEASTESGASADGEASADGGETKSDDKWLHRWAPVAGMGEAGVYGGVFLAADGHELFEPSLSLPEQGWQPLRKANADLGVRAGYYPWKWVGFEGEFGVIPLSTDTGGALGYTFRGQVVGQLAKWSVTPFVLLGAGGLGVSSDRAVLGNDLDPALHFGGGVKFFLNRSLMLRLDVRDVVGNSRGVSEAFSELGSVEILLGLSYTFGRPAPEPGPEPEPEPEPEPAGPADRDGDGFLDDQDSCPDEPGVEPDGCPPGDKDGDGIFDIDDKCPETFGVEEFEGCPPPDTDKDGIPDADDKCIEEPETKNGYEDEDGCPDEIPSDVSSFTGVLEGIYFDTDKATIRKKSEPVLNKALEVLEKYPGLKVEIGGHTDSRGSREHNVDLSERRAKAVVKWFVDHGVSAGRLTAAGYGPDHPIDSNDTKAGRAKNRRIEFKLDTH